MVNFLVLMLRRRPWTFPRVLLTGVIATLLGALAVRSSSALRAPSGIDIFAPSHENLLTFSAFAINTVLFGVAAVLLASERLHEELLYLATHDPLTNTLTRRQMVVEMTREIERARRHLRPMTVLAMDLGATRSLAVLDDAAEAALLEEVRRRGPVRAADFSGERPRGGWWDWKKEKAWLEAWFALGELMVARRDGFQRVYDLTFKPRLRAA